MKNKSTTDLRLVNILLIFGMSLALLVSTSSSQTISASFQGGSPGPNNSNSNQSAGSSSSGASSNPNQQAIDHINQAQSSLQNGDTEGAQRNMDLAKNALGCTPKWPDPC
jgi:hypothetical protein